MPELLLNRQFPSSTSDLEYQFRKLESDWLAGTEFLSDPSKITGHPVFQQIIDLGEDVVPFMLRDLEAKPRLWVWALPLITHDDPVAAEDQGNIARMSGAWLKWGREKGLR